MNITDIDDKIIKKSLETGKNWKQLANEFEADFWRDLTNLNVQLPDIRLRVTDKIPEIIKFIEEIEKKEFTKVSEDGSVYFNTSKYENYGKLQNIGTNDSDADASNFALWKGAKPNEPSWKTKWGEGRPGWHIECSTLASIIFGNQIDFHAGGIDLRFPHHENEEAQSCVHHGVQDWVTHWIHTGHLHLKGQEKMSKSLKNTKTIQEMLNEYSCEQFRIACLLSHYRSPVEFGSELMESAEKILSKFQSFQDDSNAFISGCKDSRINEQELKLAYENCVKEIDEALKDDFNTPNVITSCMKLMTNASKMINSSESIDSRDGSEIFLIQSISNHLKNTLNMLGVESRSNANENSEGKLDKIVESILKIRSEIRIKAKESKNKELFKVCDLIRDELAKNNVIVKDHDNKSSFSIK